MKKNKRLVSLLMVCLLVLSMTACSGGGKEQTQAPAPTTAPTTAGEGKPELTLNLGMDSPEDTVTYLFSDKFAKILNEKTKGKIVVQVFPNGQLGKDTELAESVQAGEIDFVVQNTAPEVNFVPGLAVFDMASVFPDVKTARTALDGPFFDKISAEYEKAGFKVLGFVDQGFRQMSTNKKVEKLADFKGQKIRTMQNPYHVEYWKALGANPTPMAWGEVYVGLQQKTIDAQENPYEVIVSAKLYEQQKYVINTNHVFHTIALVTNANKFNGYSAEYQQAIKEAAQEAKVWAREQADNRVADRVKIMKDNGVEILDITPELYQQMKERAKSEYDLIRSKIGNDLVDALIKAVEEAK